MMGRLSRLGNFTSIAQNVIALTVLLIFWECLGRSGIVHISLFPPPSLVMRAMVEMTLSGELLGDLFASMKRALLGLFLGSLLGVSIGLLTGRVRFANNFVAPVIHLFRPLPPVAMIPLILIWFGIGEMSKVVSIGFAVFFPVWINAHVGAQEIPRTFLWTAKILRMSHLDVLKKVVFPAALPFIVAGFRTGIAMAFIMVFVSELAGASSGIGYQIHISHLAYRVDRMMAALVILAVAGALVDLCLSRLVWTIFPWLKFTARK